MFGKVRNCALRRALEAANLLRRGCRVAGANLDSAPFSRSLYIEYGRSRHALNILAAYLGLTLVPAVLAARSVGTGVALGAHIAGLILAIYASRRLTRRDQATNSREARVAALLAWLPLLVVPLLYAELPILMKGAGSAFHDDIVQQWERWLFAGSSPAQSLAPALSSGTSPIVTLVISEVLHAAYISFYGIIYVPVIVLFVRKERDAFATAVIGLTSVFAVSYLIFVFFPVQGPRYLWEPSQAVPDGFFRAFTQRVLEEGSSSGTAFPSAHVAIAVTQSLFALWRQRAFGAVLSALTILLMIGAVYGGYHYAIDVLVGGVVGLAAGIGLRRLASAQALTRAHAREAGAIAAS